MLLFQIPCLAEQVLLNAGAAFDSMAPTEDVREDYRYMFEQLCRPEIDTDAAAVTAGLNWYRANVKPAAFATEAVLDLPHVSCNTMMAYPTGDAVLSEHCPKQSDQYVDAPGTFRYERLESPSHWPAIEVPEATTALLSLLEFLRSQ